MNEPIEEVDTTASGNKFHGLKTRCEYLYDTGILFILGFSIRLLCPLSCPDPVRRNGEHSLGSKAFLIIVYIKNQLISNSAIGQRNGV